MGVVQALKVIFSHVLDGGYPAPLRPDCAPDLWRGAARVMGGCFLSI